MYYAKFTWFYRSRLYVNNILFSEVLMAKQLPCMYLVARPWEMFLFITLGTFGSHDDETGGLI